MKYHTFEEFVEAESESVSEFYARQPDKGALKLCIKNLLHEARKYPKQEKALTAREIAGILNISLVTLWRLEKEGLPKFMVGARRRYYASEVKQWFENR